MIKLDWLRELITYVLYSSFVKNEIPVSILLIANSESGKTQVLEKFRNAKSVLWLTDFTRYGISTTYYDRIKSLELRTIIMPDMCAIVQEPNQKVSERVVNFLTSIIEEGVTNITTYNINIASKVPIRMGFIGAITKDVFSDRRSCWRRSGFISRTLPVSYDISDITKQEIKEYINNKLHTSEPPIKLKLPKRSVNIELNPILAKQFNPLSDSIGTILDTNGFRALRHLQVLACARALSQGRKEVVQEDIDKIIKLADWANLSFKKI